MAATITTEYATFKHEIMIDAIRASVSVEYAEAPILPFCNQLSKHRKPPLIAFHDLGEVGKQLGIQGHRSRF
jgi:hypothetical protein